MTSTTSTTTAETPNTGTATHATIADRPSIDESEAMAGHIQALTARTFGQDAEKGSRNDAACEPNGDATDAADAIDPATAIGSAVPSSSQRAARVGTAAGDFATIRVSYGPQNLLVNALDEARNTALTIRENRASTGKRIPMPVMRTIAELGVGKTWAAEKLIERCAPVDPDDARQPVLLVELDTSGKQISLPRGILKQLGKRGWNHGNDPEVLWTRAIDAMREFGVEIVIFDEINRAARRPSIGPVIGGDIMDLLVRGDVAVAFLGTEEANTVFNRCPPLKDRMKAPVVMKPLDWLLNDEKETFLKFLGRMDAAIAARKLTDGISGLDAPRIAKPLWDVCRGRLRPLCLLLEEALTSLYRNDGDDAKLLTHAVLAQAVEDLSIPAEVVNYNPFTEEKPA